MRLKTFITHLKDFIKEKKEKNKVALIDKHHGHILRIRVTYPDYVLGWDDDCKQVVQRYRYEEYCAVSAVISNLKKWHIPMGNIMRWCKEYNIPYPEDMINVFDHIDMHKDSLFELRKLLRKEIESAL